MKGAIRFCSLAMFLVACSSPETREVPDESAKLYAESMKLIRRCRTEIQAAPDSTTADSIYKAFIANLDSINFAVPANTDLQLSEDENDTLFMKLTELKKAYKNRLKGFGKQISAEETDSIEGK